MYNNYSPCIYFSYTILITFFDLKPNNKSIKLIKDEKSEWVI